MPSNEALRAAERIVLEHVGPRVSESAAWSEDSVTEFVWEEREEIGIKLDEALHLPALLAVAEAAREVEKELRSAERRSVFHLADILRVALEQLPPRATP